MRQSWLSIAASAPQPCCSERSETEAAIYPCIERRREHDKSFTVEHALSCQYGGFPTIRHNEVRDITAHLLSDVCHNVGVEPTLQPITDERLHHSTANTEDGARVDIKAQGFWENDRQCAFFDVRVFNPLPHYLSFRSSHHLP